MKSKLFQKFLAAVLISQLALSVFPAVLFANDPDDADESLYQDVEPEIVDSGDIYVLGGIRPPNIVMSDSAYVVNMDTGVTVYSKNPNKKVFPASLTKIMTLIVVLEQEKDLSRVLSAPFEIFDEFAYGDPNKFGASNAGLMPEQDNLTVRDALYGLMLPSGCDAANVLAYNIGGESVEAFIKMMNDKAKEIGCTGTNFSNAHGLFEAENYSTAKDLFLITEYALKHHESFFKEVVKTVEYSMPPNSKHPHGSEIQNSNSMLVSSSVYYYDFAYGIKTGGFDVYQYRNADGSFGEELPGIANLASIAQRNSGNGNFEYVVITVGAPWKLRSERKEGEGSLHNAYTDHRNLFNWAFSTFENVRVMRTTDPKGSVKVIDGLTDEVLLFPLMDNDFWALLPSNLDADSAIQFKTTIFKSTCNCEADWNNNAAATGGFPGCDCVEADGVYAPIVAQQILGEVEILLAGQSLGTFSLISQESVERTPAAIAVANIMNVVEQWWFKPLVIVLVLLTITLIALGYVRGREKLKAEQRGKRRR